MESVTINNVSSGEERNLVPNEESNAINDITIYHSARPKICTDFERIDMENRAIILNDGSLWTISQKNPVNTASKITDLWRKGDDIRLKKSANEKFVMYNVRLEQGLLVELSEKCAELSKGFFIAEVDPSGYALKTTDGKTWVTGWLGHFSTRSWQIGDRLIVNKSIHGKKHEYELIHPGTKSTAWVTEVFRETLLPRSATNFSL